MSEKSFKEEHMMKLQGKDYLPVAPRVVMFRSEHPDWRINTEPREVAGETYMFAVVMDATGIPVATAHKRVRKDAKGPAALWPLETAETGAVGRALALCGYGTLAGDLDEGEELADAPVERDEKPKLKVEKPANDNKKTRKETPATPVAQRNSKAKDASGPIDITPYLDGISAATSLEELDGVVQLIKEKSATLDPGLRKQLVDRIKEKRTSLA